ncbi:MAG: calcium-binding protein, partial [Gaiellaceae bacterium]
SGGDGNDLLFAGPGDDTFDEGSSASGADVMNGGAGSDTVSYAARTNALNVSLADGFAQDGEAGEGDLVRVDVENVNGGAGADTLTGSSVANVLSGGAGNDTIFAGAGDDTLTGGAGLDALFGSDGVDTFHAQDGQADTCNGGNDSDIAADYDSGLDTLVSVP